MIQSIAARPRLKNSSAKPGCSSFPSSLFTLCLPSSASSSPHQLCRSSPQASTQAEQQHHSGPRTKVATGMGCPAVQRLRVRACAVAAIGGSTRNQQRKSLNLFQKQQFQSNERQWAHGLGLDGFMGTRHGIAGAHRCHRPWICICNSTARTAGQLDAGQRSEAQEVIGSPPGGQAEASIPLIYLRNRGRTL